MDEQWRAHWDGALGDLVRECHSTHATSPIFRREPDCWSADETKWATDVMFRSPPQDLADLASVEHSEPLGQSLDQPCRPTTRNGRRVPQTGRPSVTVNVLAIEDSTTTLD